MSQSVPDLRGEWTDADELTDRDRHRLLTSRRRRAALAAIDGRTTPVDLDELATAVADRESDADASVEDVAVSLHHVHLPMLDDVGLVEYDPGARICRARAEGP